MVQQKATNVTWFEGIVTQNARENLLDQSGCVLWFTGLSGSGKSTLAHEVENVLYQRGHLTYVLDGDNVRQGLNKNLGFSPEDRAENIRRIGEVSRLFVDAGVIVMTAFISPYRTDRDNARALVSEGRFIEIFVDCAIEVCEERDTKGLYQRARAGEIKEFTGISAPYEPPIHPEITLNTDAQSIAESTKLVLDFLEQKKIVPADVE